MTNTPDGVDFAWPKDFALLVEFHKRLEADQQVRLHKLLPELGLDEKEAHRSTLRLASAGYIETTNLDKRTPFTVNRLTERGWRAVGAWPAEGQEAAELFISVLDDAIENEPDPEKKSKLKAVRDASLNLGVGVLAQFLGGSALFGAGWS